MPLYEYECEACAHRFEVIQKFSDPPVEQCTKCGGTVRKLLSSPAIQFKGSGWYVTDYARKSGTSGGAGTSSSGDSSTGSTPATPSPDSSSASGDGTKSST